MAHYVLWSPELLPGEATRDIDGGDWGGIDASDFTDGRKLVPGPSTPIHIDLFDDDGDIPPVFVVPALVVRKDVAETLTAAGVDNIDFYAAVLHDRRSNQEWRDYFVGNIVGLVDAVDSARSVRDPNSPPGIGMLFEHMAVDPAAARDFKVFRLMQRPSVILLAQNVRDFLEAKKFKYVQMVAPEEFA